MRLTASLFQDARRGPRRRHRSHPDTPPRAAAPPCLPCRRRHRPARLGSQNGESRRVDSNACHGQSRTLDRLDDAGHLGLCEGSPIARHGQMNRGGGREAGRPPSKHGLARLAKRGRVIALRPICFGCEFGIGSKTIAPSTAIRTRHASPLRARCASAARRARSSSHCVKRAARRVILRAPFSSTARLGRRRSLR